MPGSINLTSSGRLYGIWKGMRQRCYMESLPNYYLYGGKGVRVCDEWQKYHNFRDWAMANGYEDDLTIDRIDSSGDYCPSNCRWVDRFVQNNNTSRNHYLSFMNKTLTLAQWEAVTGIKQNTILYRIRRGWPVERALSEVANEKHCYK